MKVATVSSWLILAVPRPREGRLRRSEIFWLRLTTASAQCLRLLRALFSLLLYCTVAACVGDDYVVLQTKSGRASPPLPRIGLRLTPGDDPTTTTTFSAWLPTRRAPLPRIGMRQLFHTAGLARRAPLPRLGYRRIPDAQQRRSLPLPRIGLRDNDGKMHWNLETASFSSRSNQ